jgi:hypothetical protein
MATDIPELPVHGRLREPELSFHPERAADSSVHPLDGLLKFGPYSRSLLNAVVDPIRVALVAPSGELKRLELLLAEMERAHQPKERLAYLRPFPGFSKVFGVRVVAGGRESCVELPADLDDRLANSGRPQQVLADALSRAIQTLAKVRHTFDVAAIYLPDRWEAAFYGPEGDDFDLHDYIKASSAILSIPTQVIREARALAYPCRCSVTWRLGIAFYVKAGGTPWRLRSLSTDTAYIGLSYALRTRNKVSGRFVSCCSQVFDADGTGFEFLVYSTDSAVVSGENPYLSRHEMQRVMGRSLELYQRRHAGRSPRRIVVHKSTEFRYAEVDGCFDAFHAASDIELLQVQQETPWRGIHIEAPKQGGAKAGKPAPYPVLRGSYAPLGPREVLLWTQGDAPEAVGGRHFYKEGKGIPFPLLLRRFAGHGGWDEPCRDVLMLTKMDWNHDGLYDQLPVTLGYSQVVARVMKRMDPVADGAFHFRLFM